MLCVSLILCPCVPVLSPSPPLGKGYSQRGRPVSSGSTESSALGTQSLGHQRATHTGRKPQEETVGTLPRRRDSPTEGKTWGEGAERTDRERDGEGGWNLFVESGS